MQLIDLSLNVSVLCRICGSLTPTHSLSWTFSVWISLQGRPMTGQLPTGGQQAANCWDDFTALLQLREFGANDPQLQSSHFHSFYFYLSFQEALKSSKLLLVRFSKEKPKWKVGQEWLHLSRVLRLWWCHYWTISTLKYYSRLSPHVRCQANCFLPKLITWTLDSYQFYTAVIGNICWVYLFLTHP